MVVIIQSAVRLCLDEAQTVAGNPQMVPGIRIEAADPSAGKELCQFIGDDAAAVFIRGAQAVVRAEVAVALPFCDSVDDTGHKASCRKNVAERRRRHAQQPVARGSKPEIALVIHFHCVDGTVEVIDIDIVKCEIRVQVTQTVVSGDKEFAGFQLFDLIERMKRFTGNGPCFLKAPR